MNTAVAIRGHEGGKEHTSKSLVTNNMPSTLLTLLLQRKGKTQDTSSTRQADRKATGGSGGTTSRGGSARARGRA